MDYGSDQDDEDASFATLASVKADCAPDTPARPVQTCPFGAATSRTPVAPTSDLDRASDPNATWIEITLVDSVGEPMMNEAYSVITPSGDQVDGSLDNQGFARLEGLTPGACRVTFPRFDRRLWREI